MAHGFGVKADFVIALVGKVATVQPNVASGDIGIVLRGIIALVVRHGG